MNRTTDEEFERLTSTLCDPDSRRVERGEAEVALLTVASNARDAWDYWEASWEEEHDLHVEAAEERDALAERVRTLGALLGISS